MRRRSLLLYPHMNNSTPTGATPAMECLERRTMFSAGDLDATFGSGGVILARHTGTGIPALLTQRPGDGPGALLETFRVKLIYPDATSASASLAQDVRLTTPSSDRRRAVVRIAFNFEKNYGLDA